MLAAANGNIAAAMILSCPSCQARFLVPATHFAAGPRTVRCAHCGLAWTAETPPDPATALADQLSALPPAAAEIKPIPAGSNLPALPAVPGFLGNWIAAAFMLIVSCIMLFLALDRRDIAFNHPWTERYYDRVGLHVYHAGEGLSLRQVRSETKFDGGILQLAVEGQVHNDTTKPQPIPDILAAAIGPDDKVMQSWQIDAPAATVAPGESVPFASEIHAPKGTIIEISLHFVEPDHGT